MTRLIYWLTMARSRGFFTRKYGPVFWHDFERGASERFANVVARMPDIGDSVFSLNYKFGPSYIAWYQTFLAMGLTRDEAVRNIWKMNELMVTIVPRPVLHASGKSFANGLRKKLPRFVARQERGESHPYDWRVIYREVDANTFELDITECALKKLAQDFDADGLLPGICRMDYLFSWLMGNGFERTRTLGDGDNCCNCRYHLIGDCEWSPEKGFETRK